MRPEISRVLPPHVTPERFERITLTALQRTPDLLDTDRKSLFGAVMQCAQDGLQPDGREAALVKFGKQSAYMPMVAGLLKLARQSGEIASLTAQVVYEADTFDYWIDEHGEHLSHRPELVGDQGKAVAVYAMARTDNGESVVEVMRVSEIEKVRKASRSGNNGPWKDWWSEMARKTAIRRLFKRLPRSTDRLDQAAHRDDQFYPFGERDVTPDTGAAPTATASVAALTGENEGSEPDAEDVSREPGSDDEPIEHTEATTTDKEF
jgi:recombination protein RecT